MSKTHVKYKGQVVLTTTEALSSAGIKPLARISQDQFNLVVLANLEQNNIAMAKNK